MNKIIEDQVLVEEETTSESEDAFLLRALAENNAIITDSHIVYTSGRHGSTYVSKDALYQDPQVAAVLGKMLAEKFQDLDIEAVIGPEKGGIILSQWTAFHLGEITKRKIFSVYAEKIEGGFEVKRGYDRIIKDKKVLLVEDNVTTGGSIFKLRDAIKGQVEKIIGLGIICNLGNVEFPAEDFGKVETLLKLDFESVAEEDCDLCAKNVPINIELGKGKEFLAKKAKK